MPASEGRKKQWLLSSAECRDDKDEKGVNPLDVYAISCAH
jgi:hypothetical protein